MIKLYQNSDNMIHVEIKRGGVIAPAEDFTDAEYILFTKNNREVYRTKLDNITVENGVFVIWIPKDIITGVFDEFLYHQFVVWNLEGRKLPPVFSEKAQVITVMK